MKSFVFDSAQVKLVFQEIYLTKARNNRFDLAY